MLSLFDGYTGGHLSVIRGISVAQTRGRAAGLAVESGRRTRHTSPLSDPLHGREVRHTTRALRRGT